MLNWLYIVLSMLSLSVSVDPTCPAQNDAPNTHPHPHPPCVDRWLLILHLELLRLMCSEIGVIVFVKTAATLTDVITPPVPQGSTFCHKPVSKPCFRPVFSFWRCWHTSEPPWREREKKSSGFLGLFRKGKKKKSEQVKLFCLLFLFLIFYIIIINL